MKTQRDTGIREKHGDTAEDIGRHKKTQRCTCDGGINNTTEQKGGQ